MKRRYRPLRGVRVLSFEAAFSLPAATRVLSELGADVVRIGRPSGDFPPFVHRTDGSAINKRAVAIDLQNPEGRGVALRLAAAADVVCNNFRPRFLRGIGLTFEALSAAKPDLIMLQLSGYGTPGPWQEIGAFGPSVEAAAGMDASIGYPEDGPGKIGSTVFADQTAGRYAALAVTMALEQRRATGAGRYIDLSMYEGIAHIMGDQIMGAAKNGAAPAKRGNRDTVYAPQGIFPCLCAADDAHATQPLDDQWIAISVSADGQWRSLHQLLAGSGVPGANLPPELASADVDARTLDHDRIDHAIAAWTRTLSKESAAESLQHAGVPAGPVQQVSDLNLDPQLHFRQAFQPVRHGEPALGYVAHPHLTLAWRTEGYARPALQDARPEGADNRAILRGWLKLSAREIAGLDRSGALLPPRQPPVNARVRQPGEPLDPDFALRLGLERAVEQAT